jgi:hypothetical protein
LEWISKIRQSIKRKRPPDSEIPYGHTTSHPVLTSGRFEMPVEVDVAATLKSGGVAKVKISSGVRESFSRFHGLKTLFSLEERSLRSILSPNVMMIMVDKQSIDIPKCEKCYAYMQSLSRDILRLLSEQQSHGKESLTQLLNPTDDLSILSIFHYDVGSVCELHEDRGNMNIFMMYY